MFRFGKEALAWITVGLLSFDKFRFNYLTKNYAANYSSENIQF